MRSFWYTRLQSHLYRDWRKLFKAPCPLYCQNHEKHPHFTILNYVYHLPLLWCPHKSAFLSSQAKKTQPLLPPSVCPDIFRFPVQLQVPREEHNVQTICQYLNSAEFSQFVFARKALADAFFHTHQCLVCTKNFYLEIIPLKFRFSTSFFCQSVCPNRWGLNSWKEKAIEKSSVAHTSHFHSGNLLKKFLYTPPPQPTKHKA